MSGVPHILVVDTQGASGALRSGLAAEGFVVSEANSQEALMRSLEHERIDLITLDVNVVREDWLTIARTIRQTRNIPIIMISADVTTEDRIIGLENGADDYIAKPFDVREVLLRIRRILRRYEPFKPAVADVSVLDGERYKLDFGVLDVGRRELRSSSGSLIKLTDAEFDLLTILVRRPKRILSREEMTLLLKGRSWSPLERTLDKHIAQLRRKIDPSGEASHAIKSVRAIGYVYVGAVEQT